MSIVNILVQVLIVIASVYLCMKTRKSEPWLMAIGAGVNLLTSLFYTLVLQANLIDFGNFPLTLISAVNAFFYLLFGIGLLLTATRLVKEREVLAQNDFQKRL